MGWLSILAALLGAAQSVARIVERKQLMDAGRAAALAERLTEGMRVLEEARSLRGALTLEQRRRLRQKYDRGA